MRGGGCIGPPSAPAGVEKLNECVIVPPDELVASPIRRIRPHLGILPNSTRPAPPPPMPMFQNPNGNSILESRPPAPRRKSKGLKGALTECGTQCWDRKDPPVGFRTGQEPLPMIPDNLGGWAAHSTQHKIHNPLSPLGRPPSPLSPHLHFKA